MFNSAAFRIAGGKILSLIQKLQLRSASRGAILIEFAICMPVLIILLFYINDLVRIKRYYSQTEFVAQQFVNIIQNISQKRAQSATTDEERANLLKIKINDIKYAASLAYLSIYPGKTMYRTSGGRNVLSFAPRLNIYYVKGTDGGKASCKWCRVLVGESASDPTSWGVREKYYSGSVTSINANSGVDVTPSSIHPMLKIGENEEKIIVEVNLFNASHTMNANDYVETDKQETLAKKAFKCRLIAPKPLGKNVNARQGWYFTSVVIFTPKKGLFAPDNPPD